MKNLATILLICMLPAFALAQTKKPVKKQAQKTTAQPAKQKGSVKLKDPKGYTKTQVVEAIAVPAAIIDKHNELFPGPSVLRWEFKEVVDGLDLKWYVAIFDKASIKTRARYMDNGTPLSNTQNLGAAKTPEDISKTALTKFPGYTIVGCEEITVPSRDKRVYRVRLRQGTTKAVMHIDDSAVEIANENVPMEAVMSDDGEVQ